MLKCCLQIFFIKMKPKNAKRTDKFLTDLIARRLKEIRNLHGHSQEYVIEKTGLDIGHFENGSYVPSVVSLSIFCQFYNISLGEFFAPLNYPPKK